ncbi:MAG: hypothetical protein HC905_00665 [Bacteroidales bacterium]|nr:hypothetical protein [Bacteroidales bacterium]
MGIIAILICFIPCVGILAIVPGLVGVTLSAIAYNQAVKGNGARGLIIAALVVSILGSSIALLQGLVISSIGEKSGKIWNRIEHEVEKETGKTMDENFEDVGKDLEKVLERLENEDSIHIDIKIGKKLSDEEFQELMTNYENLIQQTSKLAKESKSGEDEAIINHSKLALKLHTIHAKMLANLPNLSEEQKKKLEEINAKYDRELENLKN